MKKIRDKRNDVVDTLKPLQLDAPFTASRDNRIMDADLLRAILDSLNRNTTIPDGQIIITVEDGNVTLEGEAEREYQRTQAKSSIEKLDGVRSVANLITIKPVCTPAGIQHKINQAFHRSADFDAGKITAEVSGTKVILHGEVRSFAEKEDAENAAWSTPGVHTVESMLEITEPEYGDEEPEPGR